MLSSDHSSDSEEEEKLKKYKPFEPFDRDAEVTLIKGRLYSIVIMDQQALAEFQKAIKQLYKSRLKSRQKARERRTKERLEKGKDRKCDNYGSYDPIEHLVTGTIIFDGISSSARKHIYDGLGNGMTMEDIVKLADKFNSKCRGQ